MTWYNSFSSSFKAEKPTFKVAVLGPSKVGKTMLVNRMNGELWLEDYTETVGTDLTTLSKKTCELEMWDTSGSEKYLSLLPRYLSGVTGIIFVVDVSDASTLDSVERYIKMARELKKDQDWRVPTVMLVNKVDSEEECKSSLRDFCAITGYDYKHSNSGQRRSGLFHSTNSNKDGPKSLYFRPSEDRIRKVKRKLQDSQRLDGDAGGSRMSTSVSDEDSVEYSATNRLLLEDTRKNDQSGLFGKQPSFLLTEEIADSVSNKAFIITDDLMDEAFMLKHKGCVDVWIKTSTLLDLNIEDVLGWLVNEMHQCDQSFRKMERQKHMLDGEGNHHTGQGSCCCCCLIL